MDISNIIKLQELGFRRNDVEKILQSNNESYEKSFYILSNIAINSASHVLPVLGTPAWIPPIFCKVTSWMPNYIGEETGASHTEFTISAGLNFWNVRAITNRRYSAFYNFYLNLKILAKKYYSQKSFDVAPFPDNRFHAWLYGCDDRTRQERCDELDKWMRTVISTPQLTVVNEIRYLFYRFLMIDVGDPVSLSHHEIKEKTTRSVPIPMSSKFTSLVKTKSESDLSQSNRSYNPFDNDSVEEKSSSRAINKKKNNIKNPFDDSSSGIENPFDDS